MTEHNWWWGHGCFLGWPWGMIFWFVFWVSVTYGIFYLISRLTKQLSKGAEKEEIPLEILKKRYAKGEINNEEFASRKKVLES